MVCASRNEQVFCSRKPNPCSAAEGARMGEVPDGFDWPAGWRPLPLPDGWLGLAGSAEMELAREVSPGHPLHGAACRAVGFHGDDPNEFLFATDRPAAPLAFVHLTWQAERDPGWPYTVSYPGWEAFQSAWAAQDAEPLSWPTDLNKNEDPGSG